MDKIFHPIAKVTKTSGLKGDVCLKPLSRYFERYINKNKLMIGSSIGQSNKVSVEMINGIGKKRKFKFSGFEKNFHASSSEMGISWDCVRVCIFKSEI